MLKWCRINQLYFTHSIRNKVSYKKRLLERLLASSDQIQKCISYWHQCGTEALRQVTVGQLANVAAHRWGDRQILVSVHEDTTYTFGEAVDQANKLAASLLELGLKPGDRLGLWGTNMSWWVITCIAAAKAGLIMVSINPAYQLQEMEYCLRKIEVKAIVMEETYRAQDFYKIMKTIIPEIETTKPGGAIKSGRMPSLSFLIMKTDKQLHGVIHFDELIQRAGSLQALHEVENKIQADDGVNIQFTSGTTGHPKGALMSHFNLVNNSYFGGKRFGFHKKKHRILLQTPFFHAFGLLGGIIMSLNHGCSVVLPYPTFKADKSLEAMKKEKCSAIYGTPTMYVDLCSEIDQLSPEQSKEVNMPEIAVCGGSLCSPELSSRIKSKLNLQNLMPIYGMTESSGIVFVSTLQDSEYQMMSTVGCVTEHAEVKVVDAEGRLVPTGSPGEIWFRSYASMLGYWNDEEKTKELIRPDQWMKTGDQFILLENGYGQVIGRIKDLIIRGGENISPREIEDYLETHPNILDAQVYGITDKRMGQEVSCSIRLKRNMNLTENEIREFCKGNIAHYKVPKYIEFVEDFPRTGSGKVQKYKLRLKMEEKLKHQKEA